MTTLSIVGENISFNTAYPSQNVSTKSNHFAIQGQGNAKDPYRAQSCILPMLSMVYNMVVAIFQIFSQNNVNEVCLPVCFILSPHWFTPSFGISFGNTDLKNIDSFNRVATDLVSFVFHDVLYDKTFDLLNALIPQYFSFYRTSNRIVNFIIHSTNSNKSLQRFRYLFLSHFHTRLYNKCIWSACLSRLHRLIDNIDIINNFRDLESALGVLLSEGNEKH